MDKRDMTINALPAYTYNWLHMNDAHLDQVEISGEAAISEEIPVQVRSEVFPADATLQDIKTGSGADMDALAQDSGVPVRRYAAPTGVRVQDDAVRLGFAFAAAELGRIELVTEEASEMTVVMDFTDAASGVTAGVQTKIHAAKGSTLRLVQIQRLGEETTFLNDIGGICEEGARIELIEVVLSGGKTYHGCRIDLAGEESSFDAEIGYLVTGDSALDINYNVRHVAPRTTCSMNASGVLRDRAHKLFRGTIDFLRGCAGATGDELEDVLLMDETVINQTIPLILCAEEDVVGNHGATIGRLDEDLLYYMESRGMNRDEIYEMMAQARIDAVVRRIPDEKTRAALTPGMSED